MLNKFSRTELMLGKEAMEKLKSSKVAVFGIGGVGSYVVEALARSGIGELILIDKDVVSETNINRQIIATTKTIGMNKVEVAKQRILEINPDAKVEIYKEFYSKENSSNILNNSISYVVDAIDTVTAKITLIEECKKINIPIISCMGTGNKLDASKFEITDINKTTICPLAKVMRKELKKRNIKNLKVLYSKEEPIKAKGIIEENKGETKDRVIPAIGSIAFVPSVAGLMIAGEVIKDLINMKK